ncbi:hypothetical protein [Haloarcula sebkhae]|uniref:Uncharacterized protein n=1 Tax=Haloarcula sebkhae TaxID=932660 RepID=A0A830F813_9EURY|nr:hypothetical protein [Haloarcula sebkhae]GGK85129.1 hypothetical protein GCM10009067_41550 [Haloarcula sebkhae]
MQLSPVTDSLPERPPNSRCDRLNKRQYLDFLLSYKAIVRVGGVGYRCQDGCREHSKQGGSFTGTGGVSTIDRITGTATAMTAAEMGEILESL